LILRLSYATTIASVILLLSKFISTFSISEVSMLTTLDIYAYMKVLFLASSILA